MNTAPKKDTQILAKPIMKWAGGKTQLLSTLLPTIPKYSGKYLEPFFGGGALFFAHEPDEAVISDSNDELINLYSQVATNPAAVISQLKTYRNDKDLFYSVRALDREKLKPAEAAARTLFLNKTCFNGLYRVNKKGQFNVPFGKYKNPKICDEDTIKAASKRLSKATIIHGDYLRVLQEQAAPGDFIFLDPPYLPISEYSDFKRYTKEQFYEEDQVELANEVHRLNELGCHVVLTNSNHPLIHKLYDKYEITVKQTSRNISCRGGKRKGEDVVVVARPSRKVFLKSVPQPITDQAKKFPTTRFMGSKQKLLTEIKDIITQLGCSTVLDLFAGSNVVGYMLKAEGKRVISNDYMAWSSLCAKALIENSEHTLSDNEIDSLLKEKQPVNTFVQDTFEGLYFTDEDNRSIDIIRSNAYRIRNPYKRALAIAALCRACCKKRARGIFTYTGFKYDDGRKDLKLSIDEHYRLAAQNFNEAVFDNGHKNKCRRGDALSIRTDADLVYIDPPYFSTSSDNEYVRRYHFVEGIACNWEGVEMQWHTKTKKFKNYPTPFSSKVGARDAFSRLFKKFREKKIVVSYSSNSLPTLDEMVSIMSKYKDNVDVVSLDYRYHFGNQGHKVGNNKNNVQEYIFIGY